MGTDEFVAERGDDLGQMLFHGGLGGPAFFVGGLAEVAVGDEIDALLKEFFYGGHGGDGFRRGCGNDRIEAGVGDELICRISTLPL
jgi:hypothetical protein